MDAFIDQLDVLDFQGVVEPHNVGTSWGREQLLTLIFYRFAEIYDKSIYKTFRRFLEFSLLIEALIALTVLTAMHFTYVNNPSTSNCLANVGMPSGSPTVLRVEVKRKTDLSDFTEDNLSLPSLSLDDLCSGVLDLTNSKTQSHGYNNLTSYKEVLLASYANNTRVNKSDLVNFYWPEEKFSLNDWFVNLCNSLSQWLTEFNLQVDWMLEEISNYFIQTEDLVVEYSESSGLLFINYEMRMKLNISLVNITLDPDTNRCFGVSVYKRVLLEEFFGFKDIITLSMENFLISNNKSEGYYKILGSGKVMKLNKERTTSIAHTIMAVISMLIFVTFSSLILHFGYHCFSVALVDLIHFRNSLTNLPIGPVIMSIVALIGFRDLMKHMFYDNRTFLYSLIAIWMASQFSMICCKSNISKRYWPKFFCLYHFVFYIYYFRYNGRFAMLTMATSWLFIQHSMLYFFHHYELPAMHSRLRVRRALVELQRNGPSRIESQANRIRFHIGQPGSENVDNSNNNNSIVPSDSYNSRIRLTFLMRRAR